MNFPRQYHVAVYLVLRWLYPQGGMRGRFWFGPYSGLKQYPLASNMTDRMIKSVVPGFLSRWLINTCTICEGPLELLGQLANFLWARCRNCGMDQTVEIPKEDD